MVLDPQYWGYRWSWAAMWVLALKLRSFGRAATGLNLCAISLPQEIFNLCFACYACRVGDRNRGQEYSRQALYGGITPPAHVFPIETETVIPTCSLSYLKRDKLGD